MIIKMKQLILIVHIIFFEVTAQVIYWNEITDDYSLPASVKIYQGTRDTPSLNAFYFDVDMNDTNIAIRPYITDSPLPVNQFSHEVGAFASVNGGYFGGNISYSAAIYPNEVKAQNVPTVIRSDQIYPVVRSLFSLNNDSEPSIKWIYHFGNQVEDIYSFEQPLNYSYNDPNVLVAPVPNDGTVIEDVITGIGGGPTLVKNGESSITYNEEIFWGSGVGLSDYNARTAVGFTTDKHVIMFVADGQQSNSQGLSLIELANILVSLGCVEAMNLDGGGSTQMAIGSEYINMPTEYRSVPTILSIVHSDSIIELDTLSFNEIIDTDDYQCSINGNDWFPTANAGHWGNSPSLLHTKGVGLNTVCFDFIPDREVSADVYAWWVAANNRCTDTPIIINHESGIDTVFVDQTVNSSMWNYIGSYDFNAGTIHSVIVSDGAVSGTYVVADAIKITSIDTFSFLSVNSNYHTQESPRQFLLFSNHPNPFNPVTTLHYDLPEDGLVNITIYDMMGRIVKTLVNSSQTAGYKSIQWNATNDRNEPVSSGLYIYTIQAGDYTQTKKMVLLK